LILLVGRNDFQVKIRGFRIELGEIEAQLLAHDQVQESTVLAREDDAGDKALVAYYTGSAEVDDLRAHLQQSLPEFMVPAAYINLDALPLTPNGKLDRNALPDPDGEALVRAAYEAPIGLIEETIASIWCELLNLELVSRHDNFFTLGGHSLLAVRLAERLRKVELTANINTLFAQPTLKALAASAGGLDDIAVPANGIVEGCESITPAMLPLVDLNQGEIDAIVSQVTGGGTNVQDIYPLSPLQEGVLYHYLSATAGDPYLISSQLAFDSREHMERYLTALQQVLDRHDILRTGIVWEGLTDPVQVVRRQVKLPVEEVTFDSADGPICGQLKHRFDPQHYRLDVRQAPLIEVKIAQDKQENRWLVTQLFQHLAVDREGMEIIEREVAACLQGEAALLPVPVPFRDYVAKMYIGRDEQTEEAFFKAMLGDVDEPTLPYGLTDVQGDSREISEASMLIDASLSNRTRLQAQRLGVSAASLFHLAFGRILASLTGRNDVVFGTVLLGRQGGVSEHTLGMFINTLPIRLQFSERPISEVVLETQRRLAGLLAHEHASLALAQRCSGVPAPLPLFSALLNYRHNYVGDETQSSAYMGMTDLGAEEHNNYPLTLSVDDGGSMGFGLTVLAKQPVDASRVVAYMHKALDSLVQALENDLDRTLMSLEVLPDRERHLLVEQWNQTETTYPADKCIHELFEAQAKTTPDAIAVVYADKTLSYHELNRQANQLAHHLIGLGVTPDDCVAICADRSIEMVVGILGILKAGGAYVPLDLAYPAERLAYMLKDSCPVALLTHGKNIPKLGREGLPLVTLDSSSQWRKQSNEPANSKNVSSKNLAYVIYTSGSTGQPKGVMIEHNSAVNYLSWCIKAYNVADGESIPLHSSLGFDATITSLLPPLLTGKTLIVIPEEDEIASLYEALCSTENMSLVKITPAHLKVLSSYFANSQIENQDKNSLGTNLFVVGGEELLESDLSFWREFAPNVKIVNEYGPTETVVGCCIHEVRDSESTLIPIGRPISNAQMYLLDSQYNPVPLGAIGEIYIGGAGVARGYLNKPELSAERFLDDPFSKQPGARMYRSGDLGRYLPDGNIEFLGRNDFQVKIRGFRIELSEIEAQLLDHSQIHEAALLTREDEAGDKSLVAYYTGNAKSEELQLHLQARLPEHMVPAAFVSLESLPLTPNGKLDRNALPDPQGEAFVRAIYEAPEGEIEEAIAAVWCDLLDLEHISRHDNFFTLGGHSLLAVRLMEKLRQAGLVVDIKTLFAKPTLKELARTTFSQNHLTEKVNELEEMEI